LSDKNKKKLPSSFNIGNDILESDVSRVIVKSFIPSSEERIKALIDNILSLSNEEVKIALSDIIESFAYRHKNFKETLKKHYEMISEHIPNNYNISLEKKLLLGSYFSHEYSVEAAALFNPSIVQHPDQSNLKTGELRFIMSLRATGEGHISSIEFRSGIVNKKGKIVFDDAGHYLETPKLISKKISDNDLSDGYDISFSSESLIGERVIFPVTDDEICGLEDARFVRFIDDNKSVGYYATYTAYDGSNIVPKLIETKDFISFKVKNLSGNSVKNKGFALFPRKINGKYAMLSRQDGVSNYVMLSDNLYNWDKAEVLNSPDSSWNFVQIGNCGSPIETPQGWLVITHGVGAMREYCISSQLLDINDPSKVIASLKKPLISPAENEREGYVPNVVYSCGSLIHNGDLIIPYAASDNRCIMGSIKVNKVISELLYKKSNRKENSNNITRKT